MATAPFIFSNVGISLSSRGARSVIETRGEGRCGIAVALCEAMTLPLREAKLLPAKKAPPKAAVTPEPPADAVQAK
jgi:hypothetical protein